MQNVSLYLDTPVLLILKIERWRFPEELKIALNFRENIPGIKRILLFLLEWTNFRQRVMHFTFFFEKKPRSSGT